MPYRLSRRSSDYRLVVGHDDGRPQEGVEVVFRSPAEAVSFLRHTSLGFDAMRSFRRILTSDRPGMDHGGMSDEQVLVQVGRLVQQRRVRIYQLIRSSIRIELPEQPEEDVLGPASVDEGFGIASDATVDTPPLLDTEIENDEPQLLEFTITYEPPPREENDADDLEVATQAEALRLAAQDGVPFCEECEKLKKQQAAAAGAPA